MSFRKISFMRRIFIVFTLSFFLLSACASATPVTPKLIPIFDTAVPPTATAVPTVKPTTLPIPTAKVTSGPPKGSVNTVDGAYLFIKNGLLMEMKTDGSTAETSLNNHVFAATLGEKGKPLRELYKILYPNYFEKGAAAKQLKLDLDQYGGILEYKMRATKGTFSASDDENSYFNFVGVAVGPKLLVPLKINYSWRKSTKYGLVQMFATAIIDEPIPVLVGIAEDDGSEFFLTCRWRLINTNGKSIKMLSTTSATVTNCEGKRFQLFVLDKISQKEATRDNNPIGYYFFHSQQSKMEQLSRKSGADFLGDALKKLDGEIGLISYPDLIVYKD
jgi:hypothetical protein